MWPTCGQWRLMPVAGVLSVCGLPAGVMSVCHLHAGVLSVCRLPTGRGTPGACSGCPVCLSPTCGQGDAWRLQRVSCLSATVLYPHSHRVVTVGQQAGHLVDTPLTARHLSIILCQHLGDTPLTARHLSIISRQHIIDTPLTARHLSIISHQHSVDTPLTPPPPPQHMSIISHQHLVDTPLMRSNSVFQST